MLQIANTLSKTTRLAGRSQDVGADSSFHLKRSGAATEEEDCVPSRRHLKISGATTGDEEAVGKAEVVFNGFVSKGD